MWFPIKPHNWLAFLDWNDRSNQTHDGYLLQCCMDLINHMCQINHTCVTFGTSRWVSSKISRLSCLNRPQSHMRTRYSTPLKSTLQVSRAPLSERTFWRLQVCSRTQFYSVDSSKSKIGVSKCVFNKLTIKVCVSCCWRFPGTLAPDTAHLTGPCSPCTTCHTQK